MKLDQQIIDTLNNSFASAIQEVNLTKSCGKIMYFREPRTREHKAMSKIMLTNTDNQSVVYASTLALIKLLATDKTFDQYSINEFDRLNIIAHLFSNNFFSKRLNITCPKKECKHEFSFSVKHGDLLKNMNKIDQSDIVFENECEIGHIKVYAGYPSARKYLNFLEKVDEFKASQDAEEKTDDTKSQYDQMNTAFDELEKQIDAQNENKDKDGKPSSVNAMDIKIAEMIKRKKKAVADKNSSSEDGGGVAKKLGLLDNPISDTADLYIKRIEYKINGSEDDYKIDFENLEFDDVERILGVFPIAFLTNSEGVTLTEYIAQQLFERQKTAVPDIICPKCGENLTKYLTLNDFFTIG